MIGFLKIKKKIKKLINNGKNCITPAVRKSEFIKMHANLGFVPMFTVV